MLYTFIIKKDKEGLLASDIGLKVKRVKWRKFFRDDRKLVVYMEVEDANIEGVKGVLMRVFGCQKVYYKHI